MEKMSFVYVSLFTGLKSLKSCKTRFLSYYDDAGPTQRGKDGNLH